MSENLKVNSKTDILEFKRKHNLLVDSIPEQIEEKMEQGEPMEGYSFTLPEAQTNLTKDFKYVGVVKNGNKLTFVIYVRLVKSGNVGARGKLGEFTIPSDVSAKLIPTSIFGEQLLSADFINAVDETAVASKQLMIVCGKNNNKVYFDIGSASMANLLENDSNYLRIEQTFLLSDNLIPAGE